MFKQLPSKSFIFFSIFFFLTSFSLIGNEVITQNLQQKISKSTGEEKIRINIRMHDQYDQDLMLEKTSHLKDKEIKRRYVVNELKTFSQTSQKELLTFLSNGEKNQQVSKVKPLWIVNVINCFATPAVIEELSSMPGIARIDYDQKRKVIENSLDVTPVQEMDKLSPTEKSIAWNVNLVNAPDVWEMGFAGEGVVVSVLDTGVNGDHQDLTGRMWEHPDFPNHGYNFVDDNYNTSDFNRHGSHCAGTVAGNGTAGNTTGIAPQATIMALKVLDTDGSGTEAGVWEAIEFSVEHGAHIMSLSLGWQHSWNPDRSAWRLAMQNAMNAGLIAAVAAGNEGGETPPPSNIRTPGDCPAPWTNPDQLTLGGNSAVVSVGSTTQSDVISSFSSEGPVTWEDIAPFFDYLHEPGAGLIVPDVVAPGSNILSIAHNNNSGYITLSGTSMATPAVAGLMALMISKNPNITPQQISQILEESAIPFSSTKSNTYGSGRIDALAAIEATPYMGIIYEDHAFSEIVGNDDGFINPAENIAVDLTLINPTEDTLTDVSISLSVQSSYLQLTDSVAVLGDFEPGETKVFENLFTFLVAENLPGDEVLEFELSAFSDQDTETKWRSSFNAKAYAPFLVFDQWKVDDSEFGNDNGRLDPGETATLSIDIRNEGMLNTDSVRVEAESLSDFLIFEQMQVYDLDSLKPDESEVVNWLVSASQETPLESPVNIALKASSGVYEFNQNQPVVVGLAPVYSEGNIPTTFANSPSIEQEASDPGVLTVDIPEGALVTGVDVEYEITSQNGAWMEEQRSYIECVNDGGSKEKQIHAGPDESNSGSAFYERNGLGIANNVEGGGELEFRLHAFRTWGGSGSNSQYSYVKNNTWKVIVHYELQNYDVTLKLVNQFGEMVQDAEIEIAGEVKNTNEDGEALFNLNQGNHMISIEAHNHIPVELYPVKIEEEGLVEIPMERMLLANFNITDIFDNPLEDAVVFVDDKEIENFVKYELNNGLFNYRIEADGHQDHSGSFFVNNEDVALSVKLVPYYTANFDVKDQWGNEVNDLLIGINNEEFNQSLIDELVPATYAFTISATGFFEYQDEFEVVDDDVTVSVTLQADGTNVNDLQEHDLIMYPNPAQKTVMLSFMNTRYKYAVTLLNGKGQELDHFTVTGKKSFSYDISGFEPGIYFLRVVTHEGSINKKLIVK